MARAFVFVGIVKKSFWRNVNWLDNFLIPIQPEAWEIQAAFPRESEQQ